MQAAVRRHAPLALILLCGLALRLGGLSVHSLWFDEASSVHVAQSEDLLATLSSDRHMPLFFLALRGWMASVGQTEAAVRLLPALCSCCAVLIFALFAWRRFGERRVALLASALFALSPFSIWNAQELRMYALLELEGVLGLWLGLEFVRCARGRAWRAAGLGVLLALALGTHYFGALLAGSLFTFALLEWRSGRLDRRALLQLCFALAGALLVWLPWFWSVTPRQLQQVWGFQARMEPADLALLPLRQIAQGYGTLEGPWRLACAALALVAALGLALAALRLLRTGDAALRQCAVFAAAPALQALLLALVGPANFGPRYLMLSAPAVVALAAVGLASLRRPVLAGSAAAAMLGAAALNDLALRRGNLKEDYRAACAELSADFSAGDRVIALSGTPEGFSQAPLRYYLRSDPRALAAIESGADFERALGLAAEPLAAGQRLHVIFREAPYSLAALSGCRERLDTLVEHPLRQRVQHLIFGPHQER